MDCLWQKREFARIFTNAARKVLDIKSMSPGITSIHFLSTFQGCPQASNTPGTMSARLLQPTKATITSHCTAGCPMHVAVSYGRRSKVVQKKNIGGYSPKMLLAYTSGNPPIAAIKRNNKNFTLSSEAISPSIIDRITAKTPEYPNSSGINRTCSGSDPVVAP